MYQRIRENSQIKLKAIERIFKLVEERMSERGKTCDYRMGL